MYSSLWDLHSRTSQWVVLWLLTTHIQLSTSSQSFFIGSQISFQALKWMESAYVPVLEFLILHPRQTIGIWILLMYFIDLIPMECLKGDLPS